MKRLDPSVELRVLPSDWLDDRPPKPGGRPSIDTAEDLVRATSVLKTTLDLLLRFPGEMLDDTFSLLPENSEEDEVLFDAAVRAVQALEPHRSRVTADTIAEALATLRRTFPKFERTSEEALATRCVRWSLLSFTSRLCIDIGRHIPMRWDTERDEWRPFVDAHPREIETLAFALERTQRLGTEDWFATTSVVGLCTNVLPEDVLVPRLHALFAKAPSDRVRKLVLDNLERCDLPMPATAQ